MEQGEKWGDFLRQVVVMVRTESPDLGSFSRTEREDLMGLAEEEMSAVGRSGGEMSPGWMEMMPGLSMCQV